MRGSTRQQVGTDKGKAKNPLQGQGQMSLPMQHLHYSSIVGIVAHELIARYTKPLQQPLLSTPNLRVTRLPRPRADEDLVPKRSVRLTAKSRNREPKPEAQARKVMMKKLGVEVETERSGEASFDEFQVAFKVPLDDDTREAMQVLFPGRKQRAARRVRAA